MAVMHPAVALGRIARALSSDRAGEARESRILGRGELGVGHPAILRTTLNRGLAGGGLLDTLRH